MMEKLLMETSFSKHRNPVSHKELYCSPWMFWKIYKNKSSSGPNIRWTGKESQARQKQYILYISPVVWRKSLEKVGLGKMMCLGSGAGADISVPTLLTARSGCHACTDCQAAGQLPPRCRQLPWLSHITDTELSSAPSSQQSPVLRFYFVEPGRSAPHLTSTNTKYLSFNVPWKQSEKNGDTIVLPTDLINCKISWP